MRPVCTVKNHTGSFHGSVNGGKVYAQWPDWSRLAPAIA